MRSDIGLKDEDRKGVGHLLNEVLCDEYVLYTKTRNYHWNVTGPGFAALHKLFERQYRSLDVIADDVAERARAMGAWAVGTLAEFKKRATIEEAPGRYPDAEEMTQELAADHETIIRHLRNDVATCERKYNDAGTASFLTELLVKHEKMAWMLRAHSRAARPARAVRGRAAAVSLSDDPTGAAE